MPARSSKAYSNGTYSFEYSVIRVVPLVERQEFLNVGVLLSCPALDFLQSRIALDMNRLQAFAPTLHIPTVEEYLDVIPKICAGGKAAGPIGQLPQRARFHWLVAPRSTMIQFSPVHSGICEDPQATLEQLLKCMVNLPIPNIQCD